MNLKQATTILAITLLHLCPTTIFAQAQTPTQTILIDTDIGDDIDDAYALALTLASPDIKILGISSAWGDTALRSRMIDRLLCETGRDDIPSLTGIEKTTHGAANFSQQPWAAAGIPHPHKDAIAFLLDQATQHPGQITLLAIAPLTNIGAAIDRDPAAFRKLKRVVLMGGSVYKGYSDGLGITPPAPPSREYNIAMDPAAAQKLFRSGVPIVMLPLDATQLKFDETKRALLASISTPLTDSLQVLTAEYTRNTHWPTPTMFDVVAAATLIDPAICPTTPLHIDIDATGDTRPTPGTPNANVCLTPNEQAFNQLLLTRLLNQKLTPTHTCTNP
ncbi:nucleoside hydrolase [Granulicella arctica]|uniref:Inosine-uridine nucleoside N-ribohydrolase n=1 Tax=Granulicella arctica TaxID=940613 RepID=A0A7Y9TJT2_9BACT|nr:nucleoside hydrolase [Granulicella arctica]NYF78597.1 inosine-uridine nucleoside N-ribohydrolase [Granulicella arctica]